MSFIPSVPLVPNRILPWATQFEVSLRYNETLFFGEVFQKLQLTQSY
jgi:hypothetical protein